MIAKNWKVVARGANTGSQQLACYATSSSKNLEQLVKNEDF